MMVEETSLISDAALIADDNAGDSLPFEISEFSATPPHSDSVTSGRSPAESDRHSVPLSAAALPTDCGDWDPDRRPISTQCLGTCSDSLRTKTQYIHSHTLWRCLMAPVIFIFMSPISFCVQILFSLPFWEVAGSNIRLQRIQIVQVDILWPLVLAPLPHTFSETT